MKGEANGGDRRDEDEEQQQREGGDQEEEAEERRAARPSSGRQQQQQTAAAASGMRNVGYVGKHRLSAAIARLDQELQSLQDELNDLETLEPASAACQDSPEDSSWDRWFQRVRSSRSNKWWT